MIYLCCCCCCSVTQLCPTLWDPMNYSTPGFPVLHYLPEFVQSPSPSNQWHHPTISSSVTPFSSCLQSFPSSVSFPMSQLFVSDGQSFSLAPVLPIIFRVDFIWDGLFWSPCSPRDSQESSQHHSSKASIPLCSGFFIVQLSHDTWNNVLVWLLVKPSIHDYW